MSVSSALTKRKELEGEENIFLLKDDRPIKVFDYLLATEYKDKFVIEYKPTDNCNYKCAYCYFYDTKAKGITKDNFNKLIDAFTLNHSEYSKKIQEFNEVFIFIYGGEPLLHPDLIDQVLALNKIHSNVNFLIQSNGSIYSIKDYERMHKVFSENGIKYKISLSWHSDFVKPSFFIEICKFLISIDVLDTVAFMITFKNIKKDLNYIKMLKRLEIPIHVRTTLQESEQFRESEYYSVITTTDEKPFIVVSGDKKITLTFEELTTAGYLNFKGYDCFAGINSVQITPEGDIFRCDLDGLHSTNLIANVNDDTIKLPKDLKCQHCFCSIYFSSKFKKEFRETVEEFTISR